MSQKRRRFTAELKTRVALDVLSGEHTLSELASKYGVHPNQIFLWKKQAKESIAPSFSGKTQTTRQSDEARIKELHAKIGQLTVEKVFLQQAFAKIRAASEGETSSTRGTRCSVFGGSAKYSSCNAQPTITSRSANPRTTWRS